MEHRFEIILMGRLGHFIAMILLFFFLFIDRPVFSQSSRSEIYTFSKDGAWCWFQDPRAVYVKGERTRTYAQWVTQKGELQVGAFDHSSKKIETCTLKKDWDVDDHNVGAFLLLKDHRLMVFYARHNKRGLFCRIAQKPESIDGWGEEIIVSNSDRITYAHPAYLSDEDKFYVFWRGQSWKPTFATSRDGKKWASEQILLQDTNKETGNVRPYTKITNDGKSSIHFAFTDGHPNVEPQNSIYYLKYTNGQFFKADGSVIGSIKSLPIRHVESDLVYDAKKTNTRAWVWDIALQNDGTPVIAYTRVPAVTDHRYHYARWNGTRWTDVELATGGRWFPQTPEGVKERETYYSGGIALNHVDPSIVYISRQVDGIFELEKFSSLDDGLTWNSISLTLNSTLPNVRPVVPRGYQGSADLLLYMSGGYVHYTDYSTAIQILEYTSK